MTHELVAHWRFATEANETADELAVRVSALVALGGLELGEVDGSIVSSVVPQLTPEYAAMCERYLDGGCLIVGPGVKTGMAIRLDNPLELGADRLVNAVAAYERFGGPCAVVDFGTAITFDVVSGDGEYLGGVIGPGVEISMEALAARTAKLPPIELGEPLGEPGGVIGKTHPGEPPVGDRLRLRRGGRRDRPPRAARARRRGRVRRHGRPRCRDRSRSAR